MEVMMIIDNDAFVFESYEKFEEAKRHYEETKSLESITGYSFKSKVKIKESTGSKYYYRKNYKIKIPKERKCN